MEDDDGPPGVLQVSDEIAAACEDAVTVVFPEICREYLSGLARTNQWNPEVVLTVIVDAIDVKGSYPKRTRPSLKRKRESDASQTEDISPATKYSSDEHIMTAKSGLYVDFTNRILREHFRMVPVKTISESMKSNSLCLYPTFMFLDKAMNEPAASRSIHLKKTPTAVARYSPEKIDALLQQDTLPSDERAALVEYKAALSVLNKERAKKEDETRKQREEDDHLDEARAAGTAMECECCCDDFAVDRMIHCNGDPTHWFCIECSRRNAETQIGLSKYQLTCMSMDGCTAEFSSDQTNLFIDEKTKLALDRIEQETVLRLADLEDLETCPACPFAAILPPVEVDKEFRCFNPECEQVSCRLCRHETHIPKTCAEAAKDRGHSARRIIEEAMSEAMIRRCNKCAMPFVKESGCNKMMCSRPGCRNIQCYVCHASCNYEHFNDPSRGGKSGNCPLFDQGQVDERHAEEVQKAEEAARQEVAAMNPEVDAELLGFQFSERVTADDEQRKVRHLQNAHVRVLHGGGLAGNPQDPMGPREQALQRMVQVQRARVLRDRYRQMGRQPFVPAPAADQLPAEQAAGLLDPRYAPLDGFELFNDNIARPAAERAADAVPVNQPQQRDQRQPLGHIDHVAQVAQVQRAQPVQMTQAQARVAQARARLEVGDRENEARMRENGALMAQARRIQQLQMAQTLAQVAQARARLEEENRVNQARAMLQLEEVNRQRQGLLDRAEEPLERINRQRLDLFRRAAPEAWGWQQAIPMRNDLHQPQPQPAVVPSAYRHMLYAPAPYYPPGYGLQPNHGVFGLAGAARAPGLDRIQENMRLLDQQPLPALPVLPPAEEYLQPDVAEPGLALVDLALDEQGQGHGEQAPGQSADNPFLLDDDDHYILGA